jgi:hypothetical protein
MLDRLDALASGFEGLTEEGLGRGLGRRSFLKAAFSSVVLAKLMGCSTEQDAPRVVVDSNPEFLPETAKIYPGFIEISKYTNIRKYHDIGYEIRFWDRIYTINRTDIRGVDRFVIDAPIMVAGGNMDGVEGEYSDKWLKLRAGVLVMEKGIKFLRTEVLYMSLSQAAGCFFDRGIEPIWVARQEDGSYLAEDQSGQVYTEIGVVKFPK